MKLSTDVLCTSSIFLGSNRLVSRVVSFLIYVKSELKPIDLIFYPPQSGEELRIAERRGEDRREAEWSGANRSGAERTREEWRGAEQSGEGVNERRGAERSGVDRRGAERIREGLRGAERCGEVRRGEELRGK